jgi:hypothetical protein
MVGVRDPASLVGTGVVAGAQMASQCLLRDVRGRHKQREGLLFVFYLPTCTIQVACDLCPPATRRPPRSAVECRAFGFPRRGDDVLPLLTVGTGIRVEHCGCRSVPTRRSMRSCERRLSPTVAPPANGSTKDLRPAALDKLLCVGKEPTFSAGVTQNRDGIGAHMRLIPTEPRLTGVWPVESGQVSGIAGPRLKSIRSATRAGRDSGEILSVGSVAAASAVPAEAETLAPGPRRLPPCSPRWLFSRVLRGSMRFITCRASANVVMSMGAAGRGDRGSPAVPRRREALAYHPPAEAAPPSPASRAGTQREG